MTHKGKEIAEELRQAAPALGSLGDPPAYEVPEGYFEGFPERIMEQIKAQESRKMIADELSELSPFLAAIPRSIPFTVPEGYLEGLTRKVAARKYEERPGRVVHMTRRLRLYKRCLAAAAIAGAISVGAVLLFKHYSSTSLDRQLAKLSDQEIIDYLQYRTDAFDNDHIFANVSLEEETPSVLPEDLSEKDIDRYLEENLLKDIPLKQ